MKEHSMRKHFVSVIALSLAAAPAVWADATDEQTVNFSIANISEIEVATGPIELSIVAPTSGAAPSAATANSTYDITTNASTGGKKITAAISEDMPANVTLSVNVSAPTASGTSQGVRTLSSTATDVVLGLQGAAQTGVQIGYSLSATVSAPAQTGSRVVTYTIVDL
jgi:hypothetical protein